MSKKHTPGPWAVYETNHQMNFEQTTVCEIKYHGQEQSFFVGADCVHHGDAKATAELIAAAPEMKELLFDIYTAGEVKATHFERIEKLLPLLNQ